MCISIYPEVIDYASCVIFSSTEKLGAPQDLKVLKTFTRLRHGQDHSLMLEGDDSCRCVSNIANPIIM